MALQGWAKRFFKVAFAVIAKEAHEFARPDPVDGSSSRLDAEGDDAPDDAPDNRKKAKKLVDKARSKANAAASPSSIGGAAATAGGRVLDHSKKEFKRLGIDVRKEPTMGPLIDGWRKDSVSLVTKMTEHQLSKVENVLADGFGRHVKSIMKDLQNELGPFDMPARRAELIARDQILTLNSKINRHRQTAAGITHFTWTTCGDERVREEHEELDGEKFSWDEGAPEEGFPGEPIQCRCVASVAGNIFGDDDEGEG